MVDDATAPMGPAYRDKRRLAARTDGSRDIVESQTTQVRDGKQRQRFRRQPRATCVSSPLFRHAHLGCDENSEGAAGSERIAGTASRSAEFARREVIENPVAHVLPISLKQRLVSASIKRGRSVTIVSCGRNVTNRTAVTGPRSRPPKAQLPLTLIQTNLRN